MVEARCEHDGIAGFDDPIESFKRSTNAGSQSAVTTGSRMRAFSSGFVSAPTT